MNPRQASSRRRRRAGALPGRVSSSRLRMSPARARRVRVLANACGCVAPVLLLLGAVGFAATWVVQAFAVSSNVEPFKVSTQFLLGDAAVVVGAVLLLGAWGMLTYALEHGRGDDSGERTDGR